MALDHVVLGAATLDEGVAFVAQRLGVAPATGGKHPTMGTHNAVLRLGETVYLEVIAADPEAEAPPRPRWMGLDDPAVIESLRRGPRLLCWMATVPDLDAVSAAVAPLVGPVWHGERGALRWKLSVREDGALPAGGALPSLIEWPQGVHPARGMPDSGVRASRLIVRHRAKGWLDATLERLGAGSVVETAERAEGETVLTLVVERNGQTLEI